MGAKNTAFVMTGGGEPEKMPPVLGSVPARSWSSRVAGWPGGVSFFLCVRGVRGGAIHRVTIPTVGAALCEAEDAQEAVSTT